MRIIIILKLFTIFVWSAAGIMSKCFSSKSHDISTKSYTTGVQILPKVQQCELSVLAS